MSDENNDTVNLSNPSSTRPEEALKPIVLKLKKNGKKGGKKSEGVGGESGKKRKVKYSRGLRDIQKFEGNLTRIAKKASKVVSKGVSTYERERQKSARARTDGAIEDYIHNTAKAGSAALKEAANIPIDLAEAFSPINYRKRLRRSLRRTSKFIRLWRI